MDSGILEQIEEIIGYKFSNRDLLLKAFVHSSIVSDRLLSNERMEFLGDAVLGLVTCQVLFERFPEYLEGDLTKIKSMIVSRKTCSVVAGKLKLEEFLKVGKGMSNSRALTGSLAAGLLEAIIAAIYIDGGLAAACDFILRTFAPFIENADAQKANGNFKSLLQQHAQEQFGATPIYVLLDEKGPDHNRCFEAEAVITSRHFPSAWGMNKKEAEQKAAENALIELKVLKKKKAKAENSS